MAVAATRPQDDGGFACIHRGVTNERAVTSLQNQWGPLPKAQDGSSPPHHRLLIAASQMMSGVSVMRASAIPPLTPALSACSERSLSKIERI